MYKQYIIEDVHITYSTEIFTYGLPDDLLDIFKNHDCIYIESIIISIPINMDEYKIIEILQNFCNMMTVQNKIIVFDEYKFSGYVYNLPDDYYEDYIILIQTVLEKVGFAAPYLRSWETYSDISIYTGSKLGLDLFNLFEDNYK